MSGAPGGGGTVYYTDNNGGRDRRVALVSADGNVTFQAQHTELILNNDNRDLTMPSVLMDETNGYFEFGTVRLLNLVTLWVSTLNATVVVHQFDGDRTGRVHLRGTQVMFVEVGSPPSRAALRPSATASTLQQKL